MKPSVFKTTILAVAISSVALISYSVISKQLKKKSSRKQDSLLIDDENPQITASTPFPSSVVLIGDSQTARTLGDAYTKEFSDADVRFFGKPGATHKDYLSDSTLQKELKKLGCAEVILIQLGDNGVSSNKNDVLNFVKLVQSNCPNTQHIFWGGPMKAVRPTNSNTTYVNTTDPSNPRFIDTYNRTRQVWDQRLRDWLSETNVAYFSNYMAQEASPTTNAFSDSRGGDGIHLEPSAAAEQAKLIKQFILQKLAS